MSSGKSKRKSKSSAPIEGRFAYLTYDVLDSEAYLALSYVERALLFEMARQYNGFNNGTLRCSLKKMKSRGFVSSGTLHRAKNVLIAAGFLYETCMGYRPNKASLYAISWRPLDRDNRFDIGAFEAYPLEGLRRFLRTTKKDVLNARAEMMKKKSLSATRGVSSASTVPEEKLYMQYLVPIRGSVWDQKQEVLSSPVGNHLDIAISGVNKVREISPVDEIRIEKTEAVSSLINSFLNPTALQE